MSSKGLCGLHAWARGGEGGRRRTRTKRTRSISQRGHRLQFKAARLSHSVTDAIWFVSPLVTARARMPVCVTVTSSLSQACILSTLSLTASFLVPGPDELAIRACNAGFESISIMHTLLFFPTLLAAATVSASPQGIGVPAQTITPTPIVKSACKNKGRVL